VRGHYILDVLHKIVPVDAVTWSQWFEKQGECENRVVAKDVVGDATVSTVFHGIDHRFGGNGPPILFETMIFINGEDAGDYQERCCTWDEAVAQHAKALALVHAKAVP